MPLDLADKHAQNRRGMIPAVFATPTSLSVADGVTDFDKAKHRRFEKSPFRDILLPSVPICFRIIDPVLLAVQSCFLPLFF